MTKRLFIFLGSLPFAILLLSCLILFVALGTVLESWTESHGYAAAFTYGHPFFKILLALIFVNVLVSALRRYPFKKRHIPFLITHLGLLMVISGTIVKESFGVQGSMGLTEGSGADQVFTKHQHEIYIEQKHPRQKWALPLEVAKQGFQKDGIAIRVLNHYPHSKVTPLSWIVDDTAVIEGKPVAPKIPLKGTLPKGTSYGDWQVIALHTNDVNSAIAKAYIENTTLLVGKQKLPIEPILSYPLTITKESKIQLKGPVDASILEIPLTGNMAGMLINKTYPFLGQYPVEISLFSTPTILLLEDDDSTTHFATFSPNGRIFSQSYAYEELSSIISYDQGFGGYFVSVEIPFQAKEEKHTDWNTEEIKNTLSEAASTPLSPPLELLREACQKSGKDFPEVCISFLKEWNQSYSWLYPSTFKDIDTIAWDDSLKKGCQSAADFFTLANGKDPQELLSRAGLDIDPFTGYTEMTQHLIQNPVASPVSSTASNATLLSALFRAYGIHLQTIGKQIPTNQTTTLETPLIFDYQPEKPTRHIEKNTPLIELELEKNGIKERLYLGLDPNGNGLKHPALNGQLLLRYQPTFQKIPYRLRLRDARQIHYPNSSQVLSYEADLLITDLRTGKAVSSTLSMNQVYQTWDGYRFYLSNISPGNDTEVQKVHLVANLDPAKYLITYPGAFLVALGSVLLLFFQRKKTKT